MKGLKGKGSNPKHARHGDVCVEVLDGKPEGWEKMVPIQTDHNQLVVAHGETTGHSHGVGGTILESRKFRDTLGVEHIYAQVKNKPKIKHEEHSDIEFEDDEVWLHFAQQHEYSPEMLHRVRD